MIDSVQEFIKNYGDVVIEESSIWKLLVNKEVEGYDGVKGKILSFDLKHSYFVIQIYYRVFTKHEIIESSTKQRYSLKEFCKKFDKITPHVMRQDIKDFIKSEINALDNKRQQIAAKEKEKKERLQKIREERTNRQKLARQEMEERIRQKYQERDLFKKTQASLFSELKQYLIDNFTEADNFYKVKCSAYISEQEYKKEKFKFVQSWVEKKSRKETRFRAICSHWRSQ